MTRQRRCGFCGRKLPLKKGPGRKAGYCNDKHKLKAYRLRVRDLLKIARAGA